MTQERKPAFLAAIILGILCASVFATELAVFLGLTPATLREGPLKTLISLFIYDPYGYSPDLVRPFLLLALGFILLGTRNPLDMLRSLGLKTILDPLLLATLSSVPGLIILFLFGGKLTLRTPETAEWYDLAGPLLGVAMAIGFGFHQLHDRAGWKISWALLTILGIATVRIATAEIAIYNWNFSMPGHVVIATLGGFVYLLILTWFFLRWNSNLWVVLLLELFRELPWLMLDDDRENTRAALAASTPMLILTAATITILSQRQRSQPSSATSSPAC